MWSIGSGSTSKAGRLAIITLLVGMSMGESRIEFARKRHTFDLVNAICGRPAEISLISPSRLECLRQ